MFKAKLYNVNQKIPQHENYGIMEMREYFCAKFCCLFRRQLCKICSFALYLHDRHQIDGNPNFRNEYYNSTTDSTQGWFYY